MRDISIPKEAPGSPFVQIFISAGMFGGIMSPLVAALVLATTDHNFHSFGALVFWSAYFCLPAGLVCGALASIWLSLVALRNNRRTPLFVHGVLAGIVLGALLLV